jgi:flagellar biosynthetic protein FliS
MQANPYNRYQKIEAITASPLTQVAILFEHCAQLIRLVKKAIEDQQVESRFQYCDKTMMILQNLQGAFDVEKSVEGKELHHFCQTIINALIYLNFQPDTATCDQLLDMLLDMSHVWREADRGAQTPSPQPQEATTLQL